MSGLFSKPKLPDIPAMPPPKGLDESAANATNMERLRRAKAYGYLDTIMSQRPGSGSIKRSTLLGGERANRLGGGS